MKKKIILIAVILLVICIAIVLIVVLSNAATKKDKSLLVNVNLCMKIMFEELGKQFEEETGIKIINNFVADGPLVAQFKVAPTGDVVNVGAKFFLDSIKEHVEYIKPVTIRQPVIVVPVGNPAHVYSLADFTNEGVRVCICDTKTSSMGQATKAMFDKINIFEKIEPNIVNLPKSSIILMPYIKLRQADVGICWRSVAIQWLQAENAEKDVELIDIPLEQQINKTSMIAVVKISKQKDLAKQYINWVTSSQREDIYKEYGYTKFLGEG